MKTLVQQSHSVHSGQFTLKMGVVEKKTPRVYITTIEMLAYLINSLFCLNKESVQCK